MSTMDLPKPVMAFSGDFAEGNASNELEKLDDLVTAAGILFENFRMQICYYGSEGHPELKDSTIWQGLGIGAVRSVVANRYGSSEGFFEISELMTHEEVDKVQGRCRT